MIVDKGSKEIAVTKNGNLIYGKRLSNTICNFKEDRAEVLIRLHDWNLLSFCLTAFDELLVWMTDKKRYKCRVVWYEAGFRKNTDFPSTMIRGRQFMPQICQTNLLKKIRTEKSVLLILTPEQCWWRTEQGRFRYTDTTILY